MNERNAYGKLNGNAGWRTEAKDERMKLAWKLIKETDDIEKIAEGLNVASQTLNTYFGYSLCAYLKRIKRINDKIRIINAKKELLKKMIKEEIRNRKKRQK